MIHQYQCQHGFGYGYGADADAGVVAALGDDGGGLVVVGDGVAWDADA